MQRLSRTAKLILGTFLISVFFLCVFPSVSFAEECRTISSVQKSADPPANNTSDGGHVTGHIWGMDPPPQWSRKNKTLFTSQEEYLGAWRNYVKSDKVKNLNCSGSDPHQTISVMSILNKEKIGAYSCHDENCSDKNRVQASNIFFGFIYNEKRGQEKWILNTAYPSP